MLQISVGSHQRILILISSSFNVIAGCSQSKGCEAYEIEACNTEVLFLAQQSKYHKYALLHLFPILESVASALFWTLQSISNNHLILEIWWTLPLVTLGQFQLTLPSSESSMARHMYTCLGKLDNVYNGVLSRCVNGPLCAR